MIKCECSDDCPEACDFCKYLSGRQPFQGVAHCDKKGITVSLGDCCEDFHCIHAEGRVSRETGDN